MSRYQTYRLFHRQWSLTALLKTSLIFLFGVIFTLSLCSTNIYAEWSYKVTEQVTPGQKATFRFRAPMPLTKVSVSLRSGKKVIKKKIKRLSDQREYSMHFKPPRGESKWVGEVKGQGRDGTESITVQFSIMSVGPLQVQFLQTQSSLKEGRLLFKANRSLKNVEISAHGDTGERLWEDQVSISKKGRDQIAQFTPRAQTPRRVDLKIYDPYGFWISVRVVRWYAEIPHEDVLFASGSAKIDQAETPKMEHALESVRSEFDKFQRAMGNTKVGVDLQLYVAGYTDTVGDAKDNLKLSQKRAQSIAHYFKDKGINIPIIYAGFGERGLFVQTPDQTDEPKNRRVLYIVANHRPSGSMFPNANWRTLR